MATKDADVAGYLAKSEFRAPAVFFYGSDADFVDSAVSQAIDQVRKRRKDLSAVERVSIDAIAASPPLLLDFFSEIGLFGEPRFMCVTGLTETHAKILDGLFKTSPKPNPGPLLLLGSSSLKSKSKVFDWARGSGFCELVRAYDAPFTRQEAAARLEELGVATVEPAALETLQRRLATEDPANRAQTLRLIALYAEDGRLSAADLESCLPPGEDQLSGELLEGLLSGDPKATVAWLRRGASSGTEPIAQLALAARALGEARRSRGGGRVFWKTENIVKQAARRFDDFDTRLERAVSAAHQLERAARSSEGLIPEKTERLMLQIARLFH